MDNPEILRDKQGKFVCYHSRGRLCAHDGSTNVYYSTRMCCGIPCDKCHWEFHDCSNKMITYMSRYLKEHYKMDKLERVEKLEETIKQAQKEAAKLREEIKQDKQLNLPNNIRFVDDHDGISLVIGETNSTPFVRCLKCSGNEKIPKRGNWYISPALTSYIIDNSQYKFEEITKEEAIDLNEIIFCMYAHRHTDPSEFKKRKKYYCVITPTQEISWCCEDNKLTVKNCHNDFDRYYRIVKR